MHYSDSTLNYYSVERCWCWQLMLHVCRCIHQHITRETSQLHCDHTRSITGDDDMYRLQLQSTRTDTVTARRMACKRCVRYGNSVCPFVTLVCCVTIIRPTGTSLSKDRSAIKFSWKSDQSFSKIYKLNCGEMPYLAVLKNPSKNSWIRIRIWRQTTSKI